MMITILVAASLACLSFCLLQAHAILTSTLNHTDLQGKSKYLVASGVPVAIRSVIVLTVMASGNHAALMRDTLFSYVTLGVVLATACAAWLITKKRTLVLGEQVTAYYLPTIIVALVMHFVLVNYILDFSYLNWILFAGLISLGVFWISAADKERGIYIKCIEMAQTSVMSIWLSIPFIAISLLSAYFIGHYTEQSVFTGSLLGLVFSFVLFTPEVMMAYRLMRKDKIQSAFMVILDAALTSLLVLIPIVSIAVYFMDIENVTSLSERQDALTVISFLVIYFSHKLKEMSYLQTAALFGLAAVIVYLG